MIAPAGCAAVLGLITLGAFVPNAHAAGMVPVPGVMGTLQVSVNSVQDLRFHQVVRQRHDFSCGSAVLATLLTYHYQRETSESDAFNRMYAVGDQERIKRLGFSMLDMKRYLATLGLQADGYRLSLAMLAELGIPAIALVEIKAYRHFVLIKGIDGGRVLVGDPALGLTRYSLREFEAIRSNDILFLIRDHADLARDSFNRESDWGSITAAPYEAAMAHDSLANFTLTLPRASDW